MPTYKLIATDLDGTLLNSDMKVSDENRRAIKELSDMGVLVVPATGRTLCEMEEVSTLPEIRYMIYSTGAVIHDKLKNETILAGLDVNNARFVFDILKNYDTFVLIHKDGKNYSRVIEEKDIERYVSDSGVRLVLKAYCIQASNFDELFISGDIESVSVFFANPEDVESFRAALSANSQLYAAECWERNLEIFFKEAGKGNAVETLAGLLGINMEEVITIGDSGNDKQMTISAGLGLAARNACEALKEVADKVICSNDEHVLRYVKDNYFI